MDSRPSVPTGTHILLTHCTCVHLSPTCRAARSWNINHSQIFATIITIDVTSKWLERTTPKLILVDEHKSKLKLKRMNI